MADVSEAVLRGGKEVQQGGLQQQQCRQRRAVGGSEGQQEEQKSAWSWNLRVGLLLGMKVYCGVHLA